MKQYRKRPLNELSCDEITRIYEAYVTDHYPMATVATMFKVSVRLVSKIVSMSDKDSNFLQKR